VRTLLARYGVPDPTAGQTAGQFATPAGQDRYEDLLAQGLTGQDAALAIGQQVERDQVTALDQAWGLTAVEAQRVYEYPRTASAQHLAAFTAWSAR
jgi:hypothetical protein